MPTVSNSLTGGNVVVAAQYAWQPLARLQVEGDRFEREFCKQDEVLLTDFPLTQSL